MLLAHSNEIMYMHKYAFLARSTLLACLLAATPAMLHAQANAGPQTVVAIADSLPIAGAKSVVLFRSQPTGGHVVLLAADASAEAVGGALALIRRLERQHSGDNSSAVIAVSSTTALRAIRRADRNRWNAILRELKQRPRSRLGDAGMGRWMSLASPAERP